MPQGRYACLIVVRASGGRISCTYQCSTVRTRGAHATRLLMLRLFWGSCFRYNSDTISISLEHAPILSVWGGCRNARMRNPWHLLSGKCIEHSTVIEQQLYITGAETCWLVSVLVARCGVSLLSRELFGIALHDYENYINILVSLVYQKNMMAEVSRFAHQWTGEAT